MVNYQRCVIGRLNLERSKWIDPRLYYPVVIHFACLKQNPLRKRKGTYSNLRGHNTDHRCSRWVIFKVKGCKMKSKIQFTDGQKKIMIQTHNGSDSGEFSMKYYSDGTLEKAISEIEKLLEKLKGMEKLHLDNGHAV